MGASQAQLQEIERIVTKHYNMNIPVTPELTEYTAGILISDLRANRPTTNKQRDKLVSLRVPAHRVPPLLEDASKMISELEYKKTNTAAPVPVAASGAKSGESVVTQAFREVRQGVGSYKRARY